jgi:hypothetical protein
VTDPARNGFSNSIVRYADLSSPGRSLIVVLTLPSMILLRSIGWVAGCVVEALADNLGLSSVNLICSPGSDGKAKTTMSL